MSRSRIVVGVATLTAAAVLGLLISRIAWKRSIMGFPSGQNPVPSSAGRTIDGRYPNEVISLFPTKDDLPSVQKVNTQTDSGMRIAHRDCLSDADRSAIPVSTSPNVSVNYTTIKGSVDITLSRLSRDGLAAAEWLIRVAPRSCDYGPYNDPSRLVTVAQFRQKIENPAFIRSPAVTYKNVAFSRTDKMPSNNGLDTGNIETYTASLEWELDALATSEPLMDEILPVVLGSLTTDSAPTFCRVGTRSRLSSLLPSRPLV